LEWTGKPVGDIIKGNKDGALHGTYDDVQKSLAFDIKGDVFNDNGRGYNLVFPTLVGGVDVWKRRRTSTRRKI
jgi:hypothetical protein